jgi:hypothetical protein
MIISANLSGEPVEAQEAVNLDSEYTSDGSTLTKWWKANCQCPFLAGK